MQNPNQVSDPRVLLSTQLEALLENWRTRIIPGIQAGWNRHDRRRAF